MRDSGIKVFSRELGTDIGSSWDFSDDAELIYAAEGSLRIIASDGFQIFTLREGEGVFIPPRAISSVIAADMRAVSHHVAFDVSIVWNDIGSAVYRKYSEPLLSIPSPLSLSPQSAAKVDEAYRIMAEGAYCAELEARNLISAVLIAILREIQDRQMPEKALQNDRLLRMITFIKEHFQEDITLTMIAAAGNVSDRECLRSFQKSLRTSPVQYLISYRIAEGMKLLRNTTLSVSEIAYAVGFGSPSHFSRTFRDLQGMSPSDFRKGSL